MRTARNGLVFAMIMASTAAFTASAFADTTTGPATAHKVKHASSTKSAASKTAKTLGPGECGPTPDGCGGILNCGGCMAGQNCTNHTCTACVPTNPNPCAGKTCGSASDGCKQVSCGGNTCGDGGVCNGGTCCQPITCESVNDAGCTPIPDGCGGHITCVQCGTDDRCVQGTCTVCPDCDGGTCDQNATCCFPQTCAAFPNAGCQPQALGCGKSQVCNPCQTNQVCLSDGTCCTPSGCAGRIGIVDNGCGQTINCPPPK